MEHGVNVPSGKTFTLSLPDTPGPDSLQALDDSTSISNARSAGAIRSGGDLSVEPSYLDERIQGSLAN